MLLRRLGGKTARRAEREEQSDYRRAAQEARQVREPGLDAIGDYARLECVLVNGLPCLGFRDSNVDAPYGKG